MSAAGVDSCADPSKAEIRKRCQRKRILAAAMHCFVNNGFHAASMATIAKTAKMSPGLIYRYFENKNAIIFAIIASQLEIAESRICALRNADDLNAAIFEYFLADNDAPENTPSAPLFLEMSAESTRDPEIATEIRRIDSAVRKKLADWLSRSADDGGLGFAPDIARERALALVLLVDGLKARKAREPDLDIECLRNAVDAIVAAVVGREPARVKRQASH
jgi:AcrR family transcriptional regulator